MKPTILLLSITLSTFALSALAIEFPSALKDQLDDSKKAERIESNALIKYAASKLNISEAQVSGGLGSLFKVAKDNLSKENFSMLSTAIPDINTYINNAPTVSSSGLSSLLGSSDSAKKAESINYLNTAFDKLGLPKESLPSMLNTVSGYLESNGYGNAATMLEKGLNFL